MQAEASQSGDGERGRDANNTLKEFQVYQTVEQTNFSPKKHTSPARAASEPVAEFEGSDSESAISEEEEFQEFFDLETIEEIHDELLDTGAKVDAVSNVLTTTDASRPLENPSYFDDIEVALNTPLPVSPNQSGSLEIAVHIPLSESPISEPTVESDQEEFFTPECSPLKMYPSNEQSKLKPLSNRTLACLFQSQ